MPLLLVILITLFGQQGNSQPSANNRQPGKQQANSQPSPAPPDEGKAQVHDEAEAQSRAERKERDAKEDAFKAEQLRQNRVIVQANVWLAIFGGLSFFTACIFAIISYRQWRVIQKQTTHAGEQVEKMERQLDAMKEQGRLMSESIAQNERSVIAAEKSVKLAEANRSDALLQRHTDEIAMINRIDYMGEQARALKGSLEETRKLVIQNERTAQAMEQAIEESKISREIENRAFVGVKNVYLNAPLKDEVEHAVEAIFVNVGKTPALNVRIDMNVLVGRVTDPEHRTNDAFFESTTPSNSVKLPNTESAITRRVYYNVREDAVNSHLENLIVWGVVRYEDVFHNSRETWFCFFNTHKNVVGFTACTIPGHNAIE